MAEFILKDWYGKEKTFNDDKIFVRNANGELMQFTEGIGEPVLEALEVTENGTYTPGEGVDGYNPVTVNVPISEVTLQDKTITENGTFTADDGYDGLGSVTVEVAGAGGGSLPAGGYWGSFEDVERPNTYNWNWFELGGELYAFASKTTASNGIYYKYKMVDGAWVQLDDVTFIDANVYKMINPVEYNGKLHFTPQSSETKYHWTFDGTVVEQKENFPGTMYGGRSLFVQDDKLKVYCCGDGKVYVWDETADTWSAEATIFSSYKTAYVYMIDNVVYISKDGVMYTYENGAITKYADMTHTSGVVIGSKIYYYTSSSTEGIRLYCYDIDTKTASYITKIPNANTSAVYLKSYQNKLLILPGSATYGTIFQLYEVAE